MAKRMTDKQYYEIGDREAERTIHVSETSGLLRKIAESVIKYKGGAYFGIIDGIKTKVIA